MDKITDMLRVRYFVQNKKHIQMLYYSSSSAPQFNIKHPS